LFFHFTGSDLAAEVQELGGTAPQPSPLHIYQPHGATRPTLFAWLFGAGIYHGSLNFDNETVVSDVVVTPFPDKESVGTASAPFAMALSEFHFILAYSDRLVALNRLDGRLVWNEPIPLWVLQ
jgi:hypothetical protein